MRIWAWPRGLCMWFLNKSLLGLALVVGAVCTSFAGEPTYENDVYPLTFGAGIDNDAQLEMWNRLMKYKLFATSSDGSNGLIFAGGNIHITDSVGYVGSALGGFKMGGNTNHSIGGPLMFGGGFSNESGTDSILTGPSRFGKSFDERGQNPQNNYFAGDFCLDGGYNAAASTGITNGGGTILDASACGSTDDVYGIDDDLIMPTLSVTPSWQPAPDYLYKNQMGNRCYTPNQNGCQRVEIPDSLYVREGNTKKWVKGTVRVKYIHVPPNADGDSSAYNLYLTGINIDAADQVRVIMPPTGRLTKIYLRDGISGLGAGALGGISVVYAKGGNWNGTEWDDPETFAPLENSEYAGNLLIYTINSISFSAAWKRVQGTFISGGHIEFKQHTTFAGQLLASDYVSIDADFNAEDFKYVPFNPPQIGLSLAANQVLREADVRVAGYKGVELDIALTKTPTTDVKFQYCFDFSGGTSNDADISDVCTSSSDGERCFGGFISLPICGSGATPGSGLIRQGSTVLETPISVWVKDDTEIESREFFTVKVFNLTGGVFSNDAREWPLRFQIIDDDKSTPCNVEGEDNSITIREDATVILNGAFPAHCEDGLGLAHNVIITSLPASGSLTYQGSAVTLNQAIPSSNLTSLKFTPGLNENGSPYSLIGFRIYDPVDKDTSDAKTLTINVTPVNDVPVPDASDCNNASVDERSSVNTPVCTVSASDVDAVTRKTGEFWTLRYSIVEGNVGDVFKIDAVSGAITVNKNTIDYEILMNPVYPLKIKVSDDPNGSAGSANAYVIVYVTIKDVPEKPQAVGFDTTLVENGGIGEYVGWINAVDPETGRNFLNYSIVGGDPDGVFEIRKTVVNGDSVALVYTKKNINREVLSTQNYKYTLQVKVADKTGLDTTVTATITVLDDPEPPIVYNDTCSIVENTKTLKKYSDASKKCQIVASDPEGVKTLYYKIVSGNTNSTFALVSSTSGQLKASLAPNYEKGSTYLLAVDVSDAKTGTIKTSRAYALIYVIDDNDEPSALVRNGTIKENADPGDIVNCGTNDQGAQYFCVDEAYDEDVGSVLTYKIVKGDDDGVFEIVNGDFRVVKPNIDFETHPVYNLTVRICDDGKPGTTPKCIEKPSVITVIDGNERPSVKGVPDTTIDEHSPKGTVVGVVTGTDPEDPNNTHGTLTYHFAGGNDGQVFALDPVTGVITVDKDIDFETLLETRADTVFKIKVFVEDTAGLRSSEEVFVKIAIRDINEGPKVDDATMTVAENQPKGTTVGTLELYDPDKKTVNRQNTYQAIGGDTDLFTIDAKTGVIKTNAVFDYEAKTSYTLKVRVYDQDGNEDTATVTINIADVKETSNIQVTYAETGSGATNWTNPVGTLYTNENSMLLQWTADGKRMPDTLLTNLHEGYNVVTLTYTDPTKNAGVTETVGIFVSTRTPEVTVSTSAEHTNSSNIYTLVEKPAEGDTSVYVNKKNNDIVITIKEPVIDKNYSDSSCNYETHTFTVNTELDPVNIPSTTYDVVNKVVAAGPVLNDNPASEVTYSQYNKDQVKVSYTEKVAGVNVTVSYVTDKDGNVEKIPVMGPNGKIDSIEVITVSYQVNVGGKVVNVSYVADAITGQALKTTTVNNSASNNAANNGSNGGNGSGTVTANSAPVYMYSLTEGEVLYSVTYDFTTKAKGMGETTVQVSYTVNQKGVVTKDKDGNVGYAVSYTYVNEMGNSSTQSVYIVVDLVPPKVIIKSPENESVLHSNMVEVEWYVDLGDGRGPIRQDSLKFEGLQPGEVNEIVRFYRDKAGNEASDVVYVMAKSTKDVDISVEKPVTIITKEAVDKYYASKEPEKGQSFAVSIYNPQTGTEMETMVGGKFKNKEAAHDSVYPNLPGHLGPTLGIHTKVPVINSVDGLATLDDLVGDDGLILLDAVDAVGSKKVSVDEYVENYCLDEFKADLGSDISKANIYDTKMRAKIWVYTSLGQFVDYFSFTQELNDPSYASDAGVLTMYFEMKPDRNGDVHTANGRLYATGAYVYKTEIVMDSRLLCDLPPFDDATNNNKKSLRKKVKEDLLKSFGYKRPKSK